MKNTISQLTFALVIKPQNALGILRKSRTHWSKTGGGERCWCNPPYGHIIGQFVKKAAESKALTVLLIPARTDTKWFHKYIYNRYPVEFIKGRIRFVGAESTAPFPSMAVIIDNLSDSITSK